ncbi:MAG: FHA domain-containing protein [Actinomycetales bacterium]|nr:FHA domain-containing protein [Actinomycetales bacterium]
MTEQVCPVCGADVAEHARFCHACGARTHAADDTSTIPVTLPVSAADAPAAQPGTLPDAEALPRGVMALVVERGPDTGTRFLLAGGERFAIGREHSSDVFLDDVTVSRKHATVTLDSGAWHLRDEGSLNGTYINGRRCTESALAAGDRVTVGKFHFIVQLGPAS